MKHKTTFKLHKYWTDLRGLRPAPKRTDVEPADIREILAETFILNADTESAYKFRLAGSRVCSLYCRELKGKDFLSFWSGHDLDALQTLLTSIREDAAAAVVGWQGRNIRGQSLNFETLLLPLETQNGRYHRIVGSTTAFDSPYWLGVHPILEQEIVSLRMIWPNDMPVMDSQSPAAASPFDDIGTPFGGTEKPPIAVDPKTGKLARRIGHLLVYDGGKQGRSHDLSAS